MRRHGWQLWTIVLALVLAGVWWLTRPSVDPTNSISDFLGNQRTAPVPTQAELADLQSRADASCHCDRIRGSSRDPQCWADYRRHVARFQPASTSTACGAESISLDCFGANAPFGDNTICVSTRRDYGTCSDAEQRLRIAEARRQGVNRCAD